VRNIDQIDFFAVAYLLLPTRHARSAGHIFRLLLKTGKQRIFSAPEGDRIIHINPELAINIECVRHTFGGEQLDAV